MRPLFILLSFLLLSLNGVTQDTVKQYNGVVKFYPISLLSKNVNAGYGYALNSRSSLELDVSYYFGDWIEGFMTEQPIPLIFDGRGYAGRLQYKHYFNKNAGLLGWYLAPHLMYKYFKSETLGRSFQSRYDKAFIEREILSVKLLIGKQLSVRKSRFLLGFSTGLGVNYKQEFEVYTYQNDLDRTTGIWTESFEIEKEKRVSGAIALAFHLRLCFGIGI